MLKQLLTGGSILALLLAGSFNAQAKTQEPMLQSQVQKAPPTTPPPDSSPTSPSSGGSIISPNLSSSSTRVCRAIPPARPSVGGTRERMELIYRCNKARLREQQTSHTLQSDF